MRSQNVTSFAGPAMYGKTGTEPLQIRPGLAVQIAHVPLAATVKTAFAIEESPIIFGFLLAGTNRCRYETGAFRRTERVHCGGSNRITYLPDSAGSLKCSGGMHRLSIIASQEFLEPYLSLGGASVPRPLLNALSGKGEAFQWTGRYCAQKLRIAAELCAGPYSGTLRALHLETSTLRLIGLQLAEFMESDSFSPPSPLKASDAARIREARELLVSDLEHPPSLAELARLAGVNEKKLKAGFKLLFGVPVFEYFRNHRLETARALLEAGLLNVTEVGLHIGYQNLSHFSEEFRKRYGVTPKKYQTRRKKRI